MTNKDSYNKIISSWIEARNNAIVNKPVIDFADYINPEGTILDIGCGTGLPIAKYLSDRNFSISGIDQSAKMIETAKSVGIKNTVFHICDFFDFESDEKFNGIIAWDSLFHFPKERQEEIYGKVYNLLVPGGYFLFTTEKKKTNILTKCLENNFIIAVCQKILFSN